MEHLYRHSALRVNGVPIKFKRYLFNKINWNYRLTGIKGPRGAGKTTLLLQYIKHTFGTKAEALYITMDDSYFYNISLFDFAESFYNKGGKFLFIDEIHKYPNWSNDVKLIYDTFFDLNIYFSGSSAIEIEKAQADLSRRAIIYNLNEMSFREYLGMKQNLDLPVYSFEAIIKNHFEITSDLTSSFKPLEKFPDYLQKGAYPFSIESNIEFDKRLNTIINMIIENDLPSFINVSYNTIIKVKRLIAFIASAVPFKPNISELSRKTEIARDKLIRIINFLDKVDIINQLTTQSSPTGLFTKPEKIYLNNPNLVYAFTQMGYPSIGNIRETFLFNQLRNNAVVTAPKAGDFLINNKYTLEVGGRNKTRKQIANIDNSYLVKDEIAQGSPGTIPLWLFGFLY